MKWKSFMIATTLLFSLSHAKSQQPKLIELNESEKAAISTMMTLDTAAITYRASFKDVGFPPTLQSMAVNPQNEAESTKEHAGLLTKEFACPEERCVSQGYVFSYSRTKDGFTAEGRPRAYGDKSKVSLFSDQTGVIRYITQDRAANEKDPFLPAVR
jgi:hypothetical protein